MKTEKCFMSSLLVWCLAPASIKAGTVVANWASPTALAEVMCPPGLSQFATPAIPAMTAAATVECPNGTTSQASVSVQAASVSMDLTAESYGGIAGDLALLPALPQSFASRRTHSRAGLTVLTTLEGDGPWLLYTFSLHWFGTDGGTGLRFWVHEFPNPANTLDITRTGPIDLHETFTLLMFGKYSVEFGGSVIATTIPEPETLFPVVVVLLVAGGYRLKWRH